MSNLSAQFFSDEVSLPDLRSPFGAIDETAQPPQPVKEFGTPEGQDSQGFRQETTAQAVKELVEADVTAPDEKALPAKSSDDELLSRAQLCRLFEQFLGQIKGESNVSGPFDPDFASSAAPLRVSPISVNDRTEEIDQLKSLLIEAQETIIKLLTDRVDDRSKIATLEMEIKFLPGPKLTSDEQQRLVGEHDSLNRELHKVRLELEQLEKVHASYRLKQKTPPIWQRFWQSFQ